ncbi:mitochondrial import inner membrane translocase subunit Tim21 [Bufo gargarizans]|uniref:mitochondrial import inner membrane translocase subunit Tim21 n=1 Tax=Bufo gargarizans TaxID=30331 RepID=UPI001CF20DEC|nr:mitochondrial import inner membrane translocase subunit Tim21 [Bufo gargarizans]
MSLCQYLWRAAVRGQPLLYCPPHSWRAPSIGRVQHFFTGRRLPQVREQNKRTNLQVKAEGAPPLTAAQKVKEAGRDFTYLIVALIGAGITGGLLYVVFTELFSSSSPSKLYGNAFEKCRKHPEVIGAFGEPIKAFGETTRRGRRQHVASSEYLKDGLRCMRLKFYISGSEPRLQGVVHVDLKENPQSKKYEFQYIVVDIDTIPRRTIVVEDNRYMD